MGKRIAVRRIAGLGALLIASVALTAGCKSAEPTTTVAQDPRSTLARAVPNQESPRYAFTIDGSDTDTSGGVDPANRAYQLAMTHKDANLTLTMDFLVVDTELWTKMAFSGKDAKAAPKLPKTWLRIDKTKLTAKDEMPPPFAEVAEPGGALAVVRAAVDVKETSPTQYTGTVDLTKVTETDLVDAERIKKLGEAAKAVPFTATVDGQKRMTKLELALPAAGDAAAEKVSVTYSKYGEAAQLTKPAGDAQQDAPQAAYDLMNG